MLPYLESILKNEKPFPVMGKGYNQNDYFHIDLSVENEDLKSLDLSSPEKVEYYLSKMCNKNAASVPYGGYLETRNLYKSSDIFGTNHNKHERNIHLGVDFWEKENTPIYAPLDGKIHSFNYNQNKGDYGPAIILEHTINETEFYTLYGHLSLASINNLSKGNIIQKGDCLAYLGGPEVNGGYAPHLHFQIIFDMQDKEGDYQGVCSIEELGYYKENCPDPIILSGLDYD